MRNHRRYVIVVVTIAACCIVTMPVAWAQMVPAPAASLMAMYAWATEAASPTVSVIPAATNVTEQQSFGVTVEVADESGAPEPTGTVVLYAGSYHMSGTLGDGGEVTLTVPGGVLAAGEDVLTASYTPDAASAPYYGESSGQTQVVVYPEPSYFSIAAPAMTVARGAVTGNSIPVMVEPYRGFTGQVTLTAAITGAPKLVSDLPTLSFGATNPVEITGSAAGTAVLTVSTVGMVGLMAGSGQGLPLAPAGGVMLAGLLMLTWPTRQKKWMREGWMRHGVTRALYVAAVGMMSLSLMGCGAQKTPVSETGTTPGNYTVTVTGVAAGISSTGRFMITVQ